MNEIIYQGHGQDFSKGGSHCQTEGYHQFLPPDLRKKNAKGGLQVPPLTTPFSNASGHVCSLVQLINT